MAKSFGWRIDRDENEVGLLYGSGDVSREEQVLPSSFTDHLIQAWLKNGKLVRIPFLHKKGLLRELRWDSLSSYLYPGIGLVDNSDNDVRAF